MKKVELEVREAQKLADQYGFELLLVLCTPQAAYLDENDAIIEYTLFDHNLLEKSIGRSNIISVDFSQIISESSDSGEVSLDTYYFSSADEDPLPLGVRHYNKQGYEHMAKIIYEEIKEKIN